MSKRKIIVKFVTAREIASNMNIPQDILGRFAVEKSYATCNSVGLINWPKTTMYLYSEIEAMIKGGRKVNELVRDKIVEFNK